MKPYKVTEAGQERLISAYRRCRTRSVSNCAPLQAEDYVLQAAAFASPPKWHLAHTSWFFETFLLKAYYPDYRPFHPQFEYLFNSYYNGVGKQFPRPERGLLSRPSLDDVLAYRDHVDAHMERLLQDMPGQDNDNILSLIALGIEHEKQHQELLYTDIKYSLSVNPLFPVFSQPQTLNNEEIPLTWLEFPEGVYQVGVERADSAFAFDNESPRHRVYLAAFALSNRLVTNGEYQAFVDDGGYRKPQWWLADGWTELQRENRQQPLYWHNRDGAAMEYSLYGLIPRLPHLPVSHLSGYEADAFATWMGARLPTEFEWEVAAAQQAVPVEPSNRLHPQSVEHEPGLSQLYQQCWQWTGSAYRPYPGFQVADGAVGEYNGKFMCNQWVLKGSSCVTSEAHTRRSYRNFFYPQDRWQFTGLRLAKSL